MAVMKPDRMDEKAMTPRSHDFIQQSLSWRDATFGCLAFEKGPPCDVLRGVRYLGTSSYFFEVRSRDASQVRTTCVLRIRPSRSERLDTSEALGALTCPRKSSSRRASPLPPLA